jgi:hypothetical protein
MSQSPPDSDLGFDGIGRRISKLKSKPNHPDIENQRDQSTSETPPDDHSSLNVDKETPRPDTSHKSDNSETSDAKLWMSLKKHAKLTIGIVIAGIVIVGLLDDKQWITNKVDSSYQRSNPPQQIYSSPPHQPLSLKNHDEAINILRYKIETGRIQINKLELELKTMSANLDVIKGNIDNYKTKLEHQEQQARLGLHIDEYLYHNNVDEHNRLVREFNNTLSNYKASFAKYEKLLDKDSLMVKQHNELIKP